MSYWVKYKMASNTEIGICQFGSLSEAIEKVINDSDPDANRFVVKMNISESKITEKR